MFGAQSNVSSDWTASAKDQALQQFLSESGRFRYVRDRDQQSVIDLAPERKC